MFKEYLEYHIFEPLWGAAGDAAKTAGKAAAAGAAGAAWSGAKAAGRFSVWAGRNVGWPSLKQGASLISNTALQGYHVLRDFGMGGRGLFYEIENPRIAAALRVGASEDVLKRLGYNSSNPSSLKSLTFNETLRKRFMQGAVGIAAVGTLRQVAGYQDSRIPVYNSSGIKERDLGGSGNLAISMYYNNR